MTVTFPEVSPQTRQIAEFIDALKGLDRAERARLRRNAGNSLAESRDVLAIFYRILPYGVSEAVHETYFQVATLFPLAPPSSDVNLGATLRRIQTKENEKGLDRRMAALLDSDRLQLRFKLRQVVRLIESQRAGVNWSQLLNDLLLWDRQDRRARKRWAMSYYSKPVTTTERKESANDSIDSSTM